jgi:hypothetical protein
MLSTGFGRLAGFSDPSRSLFAGEAARGVTLIDGFVGFGGSSCMGVEVSFGGSDVPSVGAVGGVDVPSFVDAAGEAVPPPSFARRF